MRWTGRCKSGVFVLSAAVSALAGVVLLAELPLVGLVMLLVSAALGLFASVGVTVDEHGLTASSWFPLVRVRFPLEWIEEVEVADIEPWRLGGWGYRGSVRLFGRAAWVLRAGPGIGLLLTGGRRFLVSVDDPEAGVAVLLALLTPSG